ncbi:substrate-binding periplasmic protein [Dongshaea marina]|uniref:substrate-binding periplasmic protein n=1 Tax=Dongshaea marina TaxID=2047966 RepID=UPI000D3E9F4C|nr:transporter substrate-binding domain-containing protein [Dongshaea marina]
MRLLFPVVSIFALLGSSSSASGLPRISEISAAVGDWPPYIHCQGEKPHGLLIEIVEAAFKEQKIAISFSCYPWARAMKLTQARVHDVTFPWLKTKQRQKNFTYSIPIAPIQYVFFHLKNRSFAELGKELTEDKLRRYSIGGTFGYSYGPLLDRYDQNIGLNRAKSDVANFKKLLRGRIDLFPADFQVGYYLLSSFKPAERMQITNLPANILRKNTYLLVSRQHPDAPQLLSAFASGMQQLKEKGIEERILSRYMVPEVAALPE